MRATILVVMVLSLVLPSLCLAQGTPLEEAYALHYKGKTQQAIDMMEKHVAEHPSPEGYYFLGYAYYELKQFDKAAKYFNDAFVRKPFYSPIPKKEAEAEKTDVLLK